MIQKYIKQLLLTLCVFAVALPVAAANYLVQPLALNLDVNKRDIIEKSITLINKEDRIVRLYASVNEVSTDGDGVLESFVSPAGVDRTNTPTAWVEITRGRIELQSGETREIPFKIHMNPKTEPGKYSVFIGFAQASNVPAAKAKVMSGDAPGMLLNLSVDQEQNVFLRLEKFVVDRFVTKEKGGVLSYSLDNASRVDVIPKGEVIFYNANGNEVAALPLNTEDTAVPAEKDTTYELAVPDDLKMGKYKAFLSVEYGDHLTAAVHDTAYFYVLPIRQIIIIFVILMIIAVVVALYVHRRYDMAPELTDYDTLPMYIREGRSEDQHHDIDLKKNNS